CVETTAIGPLSPTPGRRRSQTRARRPRMACRPAAGACPFLADPALTALQQPIFWRPDLYAQTVILTPAVPFETAAARFDPPSWPTPVDSRSGDDGLHLIVRSPADEHHLWAPEPLARGEGMTVLVPLDAA